MPTRRKIQEPLAAREAEEGDVDSPCGGAEPEIDPANESVPGFRELLASRVVEQFDSATLASRLAPSICERFSSEIQIDTLRARVLELLALKLTKDDVLITAVVSKLAELL